MPEEIVLNGKTYVATVLRIESRKEDGTPAQFVNIGMDETTELSENTEMNYFIVGYLPKIDYLTQAGQIPQI